MSVFFCDNMPAKTFINKQGRSKLSALHREATKIFNWSEKSLLSIQAEHIKGFLKNQADWLSRQMTQEGEWSLREELFQQISNRFGQCLVDLIVSPANHQHNQLFMRFFHLMAEVMKALTSLWPKPCCLPSCPFWHYPGFSERSSNNEQSNGPFLVTQAVVLDCTTVVCGASLEVTRITRHAISGPPLASVTRLAALKPLGCWEETLPYWLPENNPHSIQYILESIRMLI